MTTGIINQDTAHIVAIVILVILLQLSVFIVFFHEYATNPQCKRWHIVLYTLPIALVITISVVVLGIIKYCKTEFSEPIRGFNMFFRGTK